MDCSLAAFLDGGNTYNEFGVQMKPTNPDYVGGYGLSDYYDLDSPINEDAMCYNLPWLAVGNPFGLGGDFDY